MIASQVLKIGTQSLRQAGIPAAALDAEILLARSVNKARAQLLAMMHDDVKDEAAETFFYHIHERSQWVPIAYLINKKEFYGIDFYVNAHVLVPRPGTEALIEHVLELSATDKTITVADVGTGSGCIAITLANLLPQASILATDISAEALAVAEKNAQNLLKKNKVVLYEGNLLEPIANKEIDIIVANLPYLMPEDLKEPSIKSEPEIALVGGEDGLQIIKLLIDQVSKLQTKPKYIILEFNHTQTEKLRRCLERMLRPKKITIFKDDAGLDRIVLLEL